MIRKRGHSWAGALVLALTLIAAPAVWAADAPGGGPWSLWTSVQSWFQDVLSGWLGAGGGNTEPEVTYTGAEESGDPAWQGPMNVGPGDASTEDDGASSDPDG